MIKENVMKIGFVGWRGMVGSILMQRMSEERDFDYLPERVFFSTSNIGGEGPSFIEGKPLKDANSVAELKKCSIIVTCQGGEWTSKTYPQLRKDGWNGIWIDAASTLRMEQDSIIVLDPLNRDLIEDGLNRGIKTFVGGNCTVSLMLMACHGLFKKNLIKWVDSKTYQAASGVGAKNMQELIEQMFFISKAVNPALAALDLDKAVTQCLRDPGFPRTNFGVALACNLIPWIDKLVENGQTKEEWKGFVETNKILGTKDPIFVDGICVRVGAMRCHSQALLIKLKKDIPIEEVENILNAANQWVEIVSNEQETTVSRLTPAAVSGTLTISVGRLHKARMGGEYLEAFTVGDQLLWGASEPIRRMLRIILDRL